MAINANFEGTMKNAIQIGKGGIKLLNQNSELVVQDSSGNLSTVKVKNATQSTEATNLLQVQNLIQDSYTTSHSELTSFKNTLGTASTKDIVYFATSVQGSKADTALQNGNNVSLLTNDSGYLIKSLTDTYYSNIGHTHSLLSTALQPGNNVSLLTNDSGYLIKSLTDTYYSNISHSHTAIDNSTSSNTVSTLVKRDASGNFGAGTITASLSGNASTASKLATARTITLQGDINASILFDGSTDLLINSVFSSTGVISGTYNNSATSVQPFTVDAKGRLTSVGTAVTITPAWSSITSKPTTISGYGLTDAVSTSLLGANSGVATLDSSGKLDSAQIPASLVGAVNYQGVWNASTNTPAITSSVGTKGWYYKVSVAGTTLIDGTNAWAVNDVIIFDGSTWDRLDGQQSNIVSVNGFTGTVVLTTDNVAEGSTNKYFTTARASAAAPVQTVQGRSGAVTITSADVGLNLVDNLKQLPYTQTLQVLGDATAVSTALNLGQISLTLAASGVTSGTYNSSATTVTPFTVDAKGRITSTSAAVTITPAWSSITSKPTTISGYGLTDAQALNANLTSVSALSTSSTGLVKLTNGVASLDTNSYLTANQTITVSGDVSGSGSTAISLTLAASGVTSGTYNNSTTTHTPIIVDSKGRITGTSAEVTLTPAWSSITSKPTTIAGYGITDTLQPLNTILTSVSALSTASTGYIQLTNGVASLVAGSGGGAISLDANHNYKGTDSELASNTTGTYNIALSYQSLNANTVGGSNISLGYQAMKSNVAGSNGIAIGYQSQQYVNNTATTWTNNNIAIGTYSLQGSTTPSNNTGNYNTAIGYQSLLSNTSGSNNTAIGYRTIYANTTGLSNIGIGYQALYNNASGNYNIGIGSHSMEANSTSSNNIGIGYYALNFSTGNNNTAIGHQALTASSTGNYNSAMGSGAMIANTTGSYNTAIGYQTLYSNTTGGDNTVVGYYAAGSTTTGSYNTAMGESSLVMNTVGSYNTALGYQTLGQAVKGSNGVAIGYQSQYYANNTATAWTNYNTSVGYQALQGSGTPANNTGNYNTVLGYASLYNNSTGSNNVALGSQVLQNNTTGSNNIAIGGGSTNSNNTTGSYNIGIGASANGMNSTSSYNIGIGHQSLYTNTSNNNIGIGFQALYYSNGANNVSVGYQAGYNVTTGTNNTSIGNNSGASVSTLAYSTSIGASSAVSTSNTVVLGRTTDVTVIGSTGDDSSGNKLQVTGTIGCTTPTAGDNSTKAATTAFVSTALGAYVAPNKMSINTQTGTAYTLALTDYSSALMVEMNNASANSVTIPTNATVAFPVGATIPIRQYGAGQTTIVAASGVTIRNAHATLKIAAQYGSVCVHQRATDEWVIEGYLASS